MADSRSLHHAAAGGVPAVGEIVGGKYRVEGTLGIGGMGVVLAARHLALGQLVAIKFLTLGDEERRHEATARLLREAKAAAALSGEHVVRTYDLGEHDEGVPFIVMERLSGADLGRILERVGFVTAPEAVTLVVQACRAVAEAHRAGIVHRDLKPANLFVVRRSDGKAHIKVLDFGISKSLQPEMGENQSLTGARIALGSVNYMSPEQVRDARNVDARTDVWALGVILYELVTGKRAFRGDTFPGVCAAIAADAPLAPSLLRPELSPGLEAVILQCLQKDVKLRCPAVEQLIVALAPFAGRLLDFDELWTDAPAASAPATEVAAAVRASGSRRAFQSREFAARADAELTPRYDAANERDSAAFRAPASSGTSLPEDRTQVSAAAPPLLERGRSAAGAPPQGSASTRAQAAKTTPRRWLLVLVMLLLPAALVGGLAWWGKNPAASQSQALPSWFTLTIESVPPGAQVRESPRAGSSRYRERDGLTYGQTPLRLTITRESLQGSPRVFLLALPGYRPYVIEQGVAPADVFLRAELVPEAAPASPSSSGVPARRPVAAPRLSPGAVRSLAPSVGPPGAAPSASSAPPASGTPEIRLTR